MAHRIEWLVILGGCCGVVCPRAAFAVSAFWALLWFVSN